MTEAVYTWPRCPDPPAGSGDGGVSIALGSRLETRCRAGQVSFVLLMVKNGHPGTVPVLRYQVPSGPDIGVEVITFARLRAMPVGRTRPSAQRSGFHVLAVIGSGLGSVTVDFGCCRLERNAIVWIGPGRVHRWDDIADAEWGSATRRTSPSSFAHVPAVRQAHSPRASGRPPEQASCGQMAGGSGRVVGAAGQAAWPGGGWLCRVRPSGAVAVVVPSGWQVMVQPQR